MKLLHEELTYKIRQCIFEVRNEIGAGFDEETYHQGLLLSFERHGLPFVSKEQRELTHRGVHIRNFVNDFLIDDKVILSLKCVPCKFLQKHYVQLFAELKLWKKDLGLIVNFGLPNIDIERYAFAEKEPVFVENFEYIKNRLDKQEHGILEKLRAAIKNAAALHKLGYGKVVWRKIIKAELNQVQLAFSKNAIVPVQFAGKIIRTYKLRHLIVEDKIILMIVALQKTIDQSEIASMRSYLKALKLRIGIIVNFGKSEVNISGVRAT
jgi:GxxExxY protein